MAPLVLILAPFGGLRWISALLYQRVFVIQRDSEVILKCLGSTGIDSRTVWRFLADHILVVSKKYCDTARFG